MTSVICILVYFLYLIINLKIYIYFIILVMAQQTITLDDKRNPEFNKLLAGDIID